MRSHRFVLVLALVFTFAATSGFAQQQAKKPCSSPEYRQFDFWLGVWDVTNTTTGKAGAVNRITSAHGGCVLREDYTTPGGYTGASLNFYDAKGGRWHQTWIDNQGGPLLLTGGLEGKSMVLSSAPDVLPVQRITWTPNPDGSVRQHWQAAADGKSWKTAFDGLYTPQKGAD
jgi:hypothetical protein